MLVAAAVRQKGVLADLLRALAARGQSGLPRSPRTLVLLDSYSQFYWEWHSTVYDFMLRRGLLQAVPADRKEKAAFALYQKAVRLWERYMRLVHYVCEVKPRWQALGQIPYADNSVVVLEQALDGRTRRRVVCGPGGDACY